MKKPYNELTEIDKENIIKYYYEYKDKTFLEIGTMLNVSDRAFSRVLKESGINTRLKNRYTLNECYFENINNPTKAYILGLIYADGFIGDEHYNNFVLLLKEEDKYMLERIKTELKFTGNIRNAGKGGYENSGIRYVLNFSSKTLCDDLRKLNVETCKSMTMDKLPDIPKDLMRHFIRGYFDGDGCFSITNKISYYNNDNTNVHRKYVYENGSATFSMIGTLPFLKLLEPYFNELGINCSFTNSKTKEMKYLTIRGRNNLKILYDYLYKDSDIFLTRKHDKFKNYVLSSVSQKCDSKTIQ